MAIRKSDDASALANRSGCAREGMAVQSQRNASIFERFGTSVRYPARIMADEDHAGPPPTDLAELAGRPVQAAELIGATLSPDATYRRLVTLRLRREMVIHGPDRPKALLREAMEQLGGALIERSKKLRALFDSEPMLLSLLPGAARPPIFTNADGWRRDERRVKVRWDMVCTLTDDEVGVSCRILDVSRCGAFVGLERQDLYRFKVSDTIVLRMPDRLAQLVAPLTLKGTIRWIGFSVTHQERGMGVVFPEAFPGIEAWLGAA